MVAVEEVTAWAAGECMVRFGFDGFLDGLGNGLADGKHVGAVGG